MPGRNKFSGIIGEVISAEEKRALIVKHGNVVDVYFWLENYKRRYKNLLATKIELGQYDSWRLQSGLESIEQKLQVPTPDFDAIRRTLRDIDEAWTQLMHEIVVEPALKFVVHRAPKKPTAIRQAIRGALKKDPGLKNPELWAKICASPPRGWRPDLSGSAIEGPSSSMSRRRFDTVAGEERKEMEKKSRFVEPVKRRR